MLHRIQLNVVSTGCIVVLLWMTGVWPGWPGRAQAGLMITATPAPRTVILFEDDFATYSGRWQEKTSPKASALYSEAALKMRVVSPGVFVWSVPDFKMLLRDYRIEVTADFQAGSADSWFGVALDYQGDSCFYAWLMTPQGKWQFLRRQDAESGWDDLTPPDAVPLDRAGGEGPIRLRVDVVSDRLVFWVDDQPVGRVVVEEALAGAGFGLIARAGHGYINVTFDDLVVTAILGENLAP